MRVGAWFCLYMLAGLFVLVAANLVLDDSFAAFVLGFATIFLWGAYAARRKRHREQDAADAAPVPAVVTDTETAVAS